MYKDEQLTISDWQKGQAFSPFLGFATMRACEVFDNPGIVKIAKQTQLLQSYATIQAMPVKYLKASNGDEYVLVSSIISSPGPSALFKNGIALTNFSGSPVAYDMVEYKGYIIVSLDGALFAYGINTGLSSQNWKTGFATGYYMKLLVGQDDILYIGNGNNVASISAFVAGTPSVAPTATLNLSALDLPDGQFVVTMAELGTNLLIGTQGGTNWSQRGNQRVANIYPWNRVSPSFNIPVQMQENGIHSMISINNVVYVCAGTAGNIYETDGTSYRMIQRIPWSQDRNIVDSICYFPNAIATNTNNNLVIGVSLYSGEVAQIGVYEIALSAGNPICLKQVISTNNFTGSINIGFVYTSAQGSTYIGWGDRGAFGVDNTLVNAYVGFDAVIESPVYRVGSARFLKTFEHGEFLLAKPLAVSNQIRISYRKDTQSDYTVMGTFTYAQLGAVVSYPFTANIVGAEIVQIKIELDQNEYTPPIPEWDLELMSVSFS